METTRFRKTLTGGLFRIIERKKRISGLLLILALALGTSGVTFKTYAVEEGPAVLSNIRFGLHGDVVRTVLDFSAEPDYALSLEGTRVFRVNLHHVSSDVKEDTWNLPPGIESIELKEEGEGTLVFRMTAKSGFALKKQELISDPYRLYLDLGVPGNSPSDPEKRTRKVTPIVTPVHLKKTKKNTVESAAASGCPPEPPDVPSKTAQIEAIRNNLLVSTGNSSLESDVVTGEAPDRNIGRNANPEQLRALDREDGRKAEKASAMSGVETSITLSQEPGSRFWSLNEALAQEGEPKAPEQKNVLRRKIVIETGGVPAAGMEKTDGAKDFFGKEKLLIKIGKVRTALLSLEKFIANEPEDVHLEEAYYLKAQCLRILAAEGKVTYDEAIGANEDAYSLFPESRWAPEAILASGRGYHKLGLYYEALGQFELLFREFPESEQREGALYWTAESDFQIRRYQDAEKAYLQFLEAYPDSERYRKALVRLGECLSLQDRHEEAERVFDRVIREWPELLTFLPAETLLTMGKSFRTKGRIKNAAELFLLAINVYPDSEVADQTLWELAKSYDETGEMDKAATTYALTAQLFPDENVAYEARLRLARMGIDKTPLRVELPTDQAMAYKRPIETMKLMLQQAPDEIRDRVYYGLANGEAQKGLYRDAMLSYHGLITEYPDSALASKAKEETLPTFRRLVMILKRDGDDYQIVKDYELLFLPMDASLQDALVLYTIGESYAALDLLDEAAARAREALSVCRNEDLEQTIYSKGYQWERLRGNTNGVSRLLEQYLKRHPKGKHREEFQLALAEILLKQLKYTQAASLLLDLLPSSDDVVDPVAAEAALALGKLYLQTDLPSNAVHYVSRAKRLLPEGADPDFTARFQAQCSLILADELYLQKSFDVARSFYEEVIELKVDDADRAWAAYRLALLQKRSGDEKGFSMSSQLLESFSDVEPWPQVGRTMRQISELKEDLKRIL